MRITAFTAFLFMSAFTSAQCSMCRQAAESSVKGDPNSMFRSLNSGILYLMAVPYLMMAFIFRRQIAKALRYVYHSWQRRRAHS